MSAQLHQLKWISQIAGAVEAVTPAQMAAILPGDKVPEGATVVCQMPEALKALMALWHQAHADRNESIVSIIRATTAEAVEAAQLAGEAVTVQYMKFRELFWTAFRAEMGDAAEKGRIGYGPKFEMYYTKKGESTDDGPHLDLSGLSITFVGGLDKLFRC